MNIRFDTPITHLTTEEYNKLKKIGFNSKQRVCYEFNGKKLAGSDCEFPLAEIPLTGGIYEPLKDQKQKIHPLKQAYPIYIDQKVKVKKNIHSKV